MDRRRLIGPFWPLLALGRIFRVGPAIYRVVAEHRTQWFGVCHRSVVQPRAPTGGTTCDRPFVLRAFVVRHLLLSLLSILQGPLVRLWTASLPRWPIIFTSGVCRTIWRVAILHQFRPRALRWSRECMTSQRLKDVRDVRINRLLALDRQHDEPNDSEGDQSVPNPTRHSLEE